jgi:ABC-type uncharacterized transport system permease subunit
MLIEPDFLAAAIRLTTPLLLAALGGLFSERSGVLNLGLEGMMLMGAFFGYLGALYTQNVVVGLVIAALAGMVLALIHAIMSVTVKVDQIVTAVGINMLALGITSTAFRVIFGNDLQQIESPGLRTVNFGPLSELPFVGPILFNQMSIVYFAFLLIPVVHFILFHTHWGLKIRATGEHPKAVDTVGTSVYTVRYWSVIISGLLAGLGGAAVTLTGINTFYDNITAGRGFIAFAAIVFGKWNPVGTALATLLFGAGDAFQLRLQALGFKLPYQFFLMLPYVLTLLVLVFFMGPSKGPVASGQAYVKGGSKSKVRQSKLKLLKREVNP